MEKIAILMADLSGYTAMTEVHGAAAAASLIDRYVTLVDESLVGASTMLERLGDQVVIVSSNADDIIRTAFTLHEKAKLEDHFLPIHAGIHYGEVFRQDGHLFGSTMNLTARITSRAKEGKILCSVDFLRALTDPNQYQYIFHGRIRFKNVIQSREIVEIIPSCSVPLTPKFIDPVCHLELKQEESLFRYKRKNKIHHFCSQQCMNIFQELSQEVYFS